MILALAPKNSSHVPKSPLPIVPLCLLKCKDNHMLQMENEWSSDFVFPLNDLLRSGASSEQMSERVDELCRHNSKLAKCLQECPPSVENEILQLGLRPWQNICEKMRDMQTQFGCWKTNIDAILLECSFESQKLRYDIESFTRNVSVQLVETICIDLAHLSDCTVGQYGKHCGHISKMLIGTLFTNSRDAIVKMLRMKWEDEVPSKMAPLQLHHSIL
ncbi:hypothetical protein niasHT_016339 [Heterodera trifolii]|uniref:Uncharacterized protein n=1 Tax=Heterodera trifolii TaxID=157864 RepID=A0ABD2KZ20_9BILA